MQYIIDSIAAVVCQQMNTLPSYGKPPANLHKAILAAVERELVVWYLLHNEGNQQTSAKQMGINRNTLRKYIATHNIDARAMRYAPWERKEHERIQQILKPATYRFNP